MFFVLNKNRLEFKFMLYHSLQRVLIHHPQLPCKEVTFSFKTRSRVITSSTMTSLRL